MCNKFKKWLTNGWSAVNLLQIATFLAVLVTTIKTCQNVNYQTNFNRHSLRPWVSIDIGSNITDGGGFRLSYILKNDGKTPAYYFASNSVATADSNFPEDYYRKKRTGVTNFLFPGQTFSAITNPLSVGKSDIKQLIIEGKMYVHFYLEYSDFNHNRYFFRNTFSITDLRKEKEGYSVKITGISASDKEVQ